MRTFRLLIHSNHLKFSKKTNLLHLQMCERCLSMDERLLITQ